ncbi:MAG: hypothetical protein IJ757_08720 [Clostridiales bacterium]|nr:hypothetical protein [Clostridiales bacterium]
MRASFLQSIACILLIAMAVFAVSSCSSDIHEAESSGELISFPTKLPTRNTGGSAGDLEGRTIVITIFVSDENYVWEPIGEDIASAVKVRDFLGIAADFLERAAAGYGRKAWFTTDFISNRDLCYTVEFDSVVADEDIVYNGQIDNMMWQFIGENINEEALRQEYRADNVVYMAVMDTDVRSDVITCTRNWYPGMPSEAEIVYLFNFDYGQLNPPAVYAHEILHTFGAPDYYMSSYEYGITDEFVNYVQRQMYNDIMYSCSDVQTGEYLYDRITNEVSELTAYYVGLIDSSEIADEWGLEDPYR